MKFNEKLIKLRKIKGMSQEELGYEINVTRQTISKWELGTTTPEMGSLKEISRVFNVNLDILTDDEKELESNEGLGEKANSTDYSLSGNDENTGVTDEKLSSNNANESSSYNHYNNSNPKPKSKAKMIILIVLIIVVVLIAGSVMIFKSTFGKVFDKVNGKEGGSFIDSIISLFTKVEEKASNEIINFGFVDPGITSGNFVSDTISKIADNNVKNERKIILVYDGEEIQEDEINKIAQKIETFGQYQLTYEYDKEGYINKAIIERVRGEVDKMKFNFGFVDPGIKRGNFVSDIISKIADSNAKNEKQIILVYNEKEIPADEINKTAQKIESLGQYQLTYEYDEEGYISKITIEESVNELHKEMFNNEFLNAGLNSGFFTKNIISKIADSNMKEKKQIKLIFNGTEKTTSEDINASTINIKDFDEYQVVYEYDDQGYINVVKVDKI